MLGSEQVRGGRIVRLLSKDGQWRVSVPAPDGHPVIRVERLGNGGRSWYWQADVSTPDEVARFVPLHELAEVKVPA
jgi:hypothetical protein